MNCEGDLVAPFGWVVDEAFQNSGGDELTDDEAPKTYYFGTIYLIWSRNSRKASYRKYLHIGVGSKIDSKLEW